jgi:hypothetical protein
VTGYEVYKMYLALKQHFTKESYDYHTYNGKVRASEQSFEQQSMMIVKYYITLLLILL